MESANILYDMMPPGVDPLGPENIIGFTTGPCTGTKAFSVPAIHWFINRLLPAAEMMPIQGVSDRN